MTTKPKQYSPVQLLAFQFVKEILGREFDWRFDRRWLAEAKRICEPDEGYPIPPDMVLGCLRCLNMGMFGFEKKVLSMWICTYGEPPYITQYADYIQNPPPYYERDLVRIWEELTGKVAYANTSHDIMDVPDPILL